MYKVFKIALSLVITGLNISLHANIPVLAATIKFELNFFNENNTQVGSGEFSYDDAITLTA